MVQGGRLGQGEGVRMRVGRSPLCWSGGEAWEASHIMAEARGPVGGCGCAEVGPQGRGHPVQAAIGRRGGLGGAGRGALSKVGMGMNPAEGGNG